jgi:hypothetical protein
MNELEKEKERESNIKSFFKKVNAPVLLEEALTITTNKV